MSSSNSASSGPAPFTKVHWQASPSIPGRTRGQRPSRILSRALLTALAACAFMPAPANALSTDSNAPEAVTPTRPKMRSCRMRSCIKSLLVTPLGRHYFRRARNYAHTADTAHKVDQLKAENGAAARAATPLTKHESRMLWRLTSLIAVSSVAASALPGTPPIYDIHSWFIGGPLAIGPWVALLRERRSGAPLFSLAQSLLESMRRVHRREPKSGTSLLKLWAPKDPT